MDIKSMWTSVTMKANSSWYMVPGAILVAKPTRQSFFVTYQRVTKGCKVSRDCEAANGHPSTKYLQDLPIVALGLEVTV